MHCSAIDGTTMHLDGIDDAQIWARITLPNHQVKVLPIHHDIDLTGLKYDSPAAVGEFDTPVIRARQFSARHIFQDILDWWIKITE